MGKILILAAYVVYASFWARFFTHFLVWLRAAHRRDRGGAAFSRASGQVCVLTAADVFLFARVLDVNPALWVGEWSFHASFLLVLLRHLRYFLTPIPAWVWWMQVPGLIAGYILPVSLLYILFVRLLTKQEKFTSPMNLFLLGLVLAISSIGVLMYTLFKPDLIDVKLFMVGILSGAPTPAPESLLFLLHFSLVLVLVPFLPTHIITSPLVMIEARKREQGLHLVMHEK